MLFVLLLAIGCSNPWESTPPVPSPEPVAIPEPAAPAATAVDVEALWHAQNCAACHGARGEGGVGPRLAGRVPAVEALIAQVRAGAEPMPAYPPEVLSDTTLHQLHAWLSALPVPGPPAPNPDTIATTPGVDVALVVSGLDHPIALAWRGDDLYVSTNGDVFPRQGQRPGAVYRIEEGVAVQVAAELERPLGLLWRDDALWVSQRGRVTALSDADGDGVLESSRDIVSGLPVDGLHQNNGIVAGPDGRVWMGMGSATNVRAEAEPNNSILAIAADGQVEVIATGFRNPFGLAVLDGQVYATDNGIDPPVLESAPEEVNAVRPGAFYGHPYVAGNDRREAGGPEPTAPLVTLTPHASANGITGATGSAFPDLQGKLVVAEFGSYLTRFRSAGRQLVVVDPATAEVSTWASGFVGRPLDVAVGPDGHIYVTDFEQGAVWRFFPSDRVRTVFRPSFDCRRAETAVERAICNDPELSRLDGQLAEAYTRALREVSGDDRTALRDAQRAWIAERDRCAEDPWPVLCTRDAMVSRIDAL